MSQEHVTLKPLIAGEFRMEPPDCKSNYGSSDCKRKVRNGKCPTNCKETGVCGGWGPRGGVIPTRALVMDQFKKAEA